MSLTAITSDSIGAGTQLVVTPNGTTYVLPGINIIATSGFGVTSASTTTELDLVIAGNVAGSTGGIRLISNESVAGSKSAHITSTGTVLATDAAIELGSSAASGTTQEVTNAGSITSLENVGVSVGFGEFGTVNNSGTITGGVGSVKMTSVTNYLNNTGTITSLSAGPASANAAVAFTSVIGGSAQFDNSGTITGQFYSLFAVLSNGFEGTNSGILNGRVIINSGIASSFTNTGEIFGFVSLSNGASGIFEFDNYGYVSGNVNSFDQADISNGGTIGGNVTLGGDDDVYRAVGDGVVAGTVSGGAGNDTIIGGSEADVIEGGADDDMLRGGGEADEIYGDEGNDTLRGGAGEDTLYGGTNNDNIAGNSGDDVMTGEAGNDRLRGDGGDDTLFGGADNDRLNGGAGDDELYGEDGNDTVRAGSGADKIDGGDGDNVLFGGDGNDEIESGTGNDALRGEAGNDYLESGFGTDDLRGGSGNDTIYGGRGIDTMFGGNGADVFYFESVLDGVSSGTGDQIRDFERGEDLLDMGDIGFGNQVNFIGTDAFVVDGTVQIRYFDSGNNIRLQVDFDGNGSTDMQLTMYNIQELSVDDFIL